MCDGGILGIRYDEISQDSYRGVYAHVDAEHEATFSTGDVVRDYVDAWNWLCAQGVSFISFSSTLDSFLMHGNAYRWNEELSLIEQNMGA